MVCSCPLPYLKILGKELQSSNLMGFTHAIGFLLLNSKEDIEKGAVGCKLPTIFLACYFYLK